MKKRTLMRAAVLFVVCATLIVTAAHAVFAEDDLPGEIQIPPKEGGGGTIMGIGGVGTTNYIPKFTSNTNLGNSILYELGGNVGIGTTTPGALLDVAGRGLFNYEPFAYGKIDSEDDWSAATGGYMTGSVTYAGSSVGYNGANGNATAYIGSGEIIPKGWTGTLTFEGYADASNFAQTTDLQGSTDGGVNWTTLASMGNSSQMQTLTWNPNPATASYRLRVVMNTGNGISTGQTVRLQNLKITQLPVFNFGATQTAGLRLRNGNVGIGTTNPETKLQVAGNLTLSSGGTSEVETVYKGPTWYHIGTRDNGARLSFYEDGFENQGIHLASASGNVGIGTTTPYTKLMVSGGPGTAALIEASSDSANLALLSHQPGTGRQYNIASTAGGEFQVQDTTAGGATPFRIFGNTSNSTLVLNGGNVGIGTTSPSQKLDVAGYVKGQTGLCISDDCRTSWPSSGGGNIIGSGSTNYLAKFTGANSIGNGTIFDNGNVGIGTTSPISPLQVQGSTSSKNPIVRITNFDQGQGILVRTSSTADGNSAVEAQATASSGNTFGVFGITNSTAGSGGSTVGVYGLAQNAQSNGGATLGVLGESHSIPATGSDTSNGVFGWGKIGGAYGRTYGVWGETDSMGPPSGQSGPVSGVTGVATNSSANSLSDGVVGRAVSPSTSSFGVYYQGGLSGIGGITSIIRTDSGPRLIYATQSPEPWVEDYGEGKLKNGYVRINLDPVYLQTVAVDASHSFHVFVTPTGTASLNGLRVIKDATGFRVQELNGGKSSATFDWRIVAKRKDLADRRLDISEGAYSDPTLYPERFPDAQLTHEDLQTAQPTE